MSELEGRFGKASDMKKSVCLISLPSPFLIDEKVFPSLGLLYLGKHLKNSKYQVIVHDGKMEDIPQGFDVYGLSATTPQFPKAVEYLKHLRGFEKYSQIIIGGPHASVDPESCINAGFDSVVLQAGEASTPIAIEHKCKLIDTPYDGMLHPDRSLIDIKSYHYTVDGRPATSVMTTRGCPYRCGFCCKINKRVKVYPAEFVLDELRLLKSLYGYKAFMFFDDLFIIDQKRLSVIMDEITTWDIRWRGFVRADLVYRNGVEMAKRMYESGCREVGMGIESGSDKILKAVNKDETTEHLKRGIDTLHKANIRVKGFLIVGLPSESPETIEETRKFLLEAGLDDVDFSLFTPYKKSPIYDNREKFDIHWDQIDLEKSFYKGTPGEYEAQVWTEKMSRQDLVAARDSLENEFKKWE